jgi:quercetin dioxygenase-like cupin family protein
MEIVARPPAFKGPAGWFAGDVWVDTLYRGDEPSRIRAGIARFVPGARSAWHSHGLGQALYIVEGIALIGARGALIIEAHPGDVVWAPPGQEHWHGAAPGQFMTHLALWEGDAVDWLEHVTDHDYQAPRTRSASPDHQLPS